MANAIKFSFEQTLGGESVETNFQESAENRARSTRAFDVVCVSGVATTAQAYAAARGHVAAAFPRDIFGNPIASISLSETTAANRAWKFEARYSSKAEVPKDWYDYCYVDSYDGSSESATRTQSLGTRIFPTPGGCAVDYGGAIDVADGVARGVQIASPIDRFSVRLRLKHTPERLAYLRSLGAYRQKTNAAPFWEYAPGEVLFESYSFSLAGVADDGSFKNAYFDGRLNFAARRSEPTNIDGAEFVKGGWEAVWALKVEADGADGRKRLKTLCAYAETVYPSADFDELKLARLGFDG